MRNCRGLYQVRDVIGSISAYESDRTSSNLVHLTILSPDRLKSKTQTLGV